MNLATGTSLAYCQSTLPVAGNAAGYQRRHARARAGGRARRGEGEGKGKGEGKARPRTLLVSFFQITSKLFCSFQCLFSALRCSQTDAQRFFISFIFCAERSTRLISAILKHSQNLGFSPIFTHSHCSHCTQSLTINLDHIGRCERAY